VYDTGRLKGEKKNKEREEKEKRRRMRVNTYSRKEKIERLKVQRTA
jgi:hypothetical protein